MCVTVCSFPSTSARISKSDFAKKTTVEKEGLTLRILGMHASNFANYKKTRHCDCQWQLVKYFLLIQINMQFTCRAESVFNIKKNDIKNSKKHLEKKYRQTIRPLSSRPIFFQTTQASFETFYEGKRNSLKILEESYIFLTLSNIMKNEFLDCHKVAKSQRSLKRLFFPRLIFSHGACNVLEKNESK